MVRALVTGGCGFVGRHLCDRLLAEGLDIVCVDSLKPRTGAKHPALWRRPSKHFIFLEEDCRSFFETSSQRFDYVFHLAALVGGRMTLENETLLVAEDLSVDAALWRWAGCNKPGNVVYFSSSAAYPVAFQTEEMQTALSEEMISFERPLGVPDLSYGWTKLTGEYLMKLYVERYGGRAIAYRPFSGYGEDQDIAYPFPAICQRLVKEWGAAEVSVWGSGRQRRDFIHIADCIDFIWQTVHRLPTGTSMNLSTGGTTSFIELAVLISQELGWSPEVAGTTSRPEGVFFRCGDTALQQRFGLAPRISLQEGVRRSLDYLRVEAAAYV
ncbi:epimerase [Rhizobium sullae]|uniref:Epimerase n=1 Tax=Rhizobium sullae TaxID=50338 RepID=A0A2N0CZ07_RHISU|nr:NAD-dependent epimerase/dehydratase family protein [Rhizobium sullae]PKA39048.1 epimerase [Rhizobium sullae]